MPKNTKSIDKLEKKIRVKLMGRIHDGTALDRYTEDIMFDVKAALKALIERQKNLARIEELEIVYGWRVRNLVKADGIKDRIKELMKPKHTGGKP